MEEIDPALKIALWKDRNFTIQISLELEALLTGTLPATQITYPPLNSYQRMLVHRIAEHYTLGHDLVSDGITVYLTPNSQL